MTVGERIKRKREELRISQTDLARRIGVSKQSLYKYETDVVTNIPFIIIEQIAIVLDVSPCYLMGWEQKTQSKNKSPKIVQYYNQLNDIGKHEAEKRVEELTYFPRYTLEVKAAHNDYESEPGELEKMKEDISNLKKPD